MEIKKKNFFFDKEQIHCSARTKLEYYYFTLFYPTGFKGFLYFTQF
jgi:hypothetical protein